MFINYRVTLLVMMMELIREQIETCGKSRYQISAETGIDKAALCRIMQGGGCYSDTADRLCEYFGLELVEKKRKKKEAKK